MPISGESPKICTLLYVINDWDAVQAWASRTEWKSLVVPFASLSAVDCIAACLDAAANRALLAWPNWYGDGLFAEAPTESLDDRLHALRVAVDLSRSNQSIEPAWLKKATHLAAAGKPPLIPGLVAEIQIRQLALAFTGSVINIMLAVPPELLNAGDCKGFPYAVEWLARESGLNVTVLLPQAMAANESLSPLLYRVANWTTGSPDSCGADTLANMTVPPPDVETASLFSSPAIPEESATEAERIIGSPHPRSRGEQLLAERLTHDPQLSGLFGYNQPLQTRCGHRFIVDLLWREGRVVVEVDGYYFHSNSVAFADDRDRDYRLLLSGYRVLRLPHDEIVRDVDLAVEKIRDVVHFVRNQEAR